MQRVSRVLLKGMCDTRAYPRPAQPARLAFEKSFWSPLPVLFYWHRLYFTYVEHFSLAASGPFARICLALVERAVFALFR